MKSIYSNCIETFANHDSVDQENHNEKDRSSLHYGVHLQLYQNNIYLIHTTTDFTVATML